MEVTKIKGRLVHGDWILVLLIINIVASVLHYVHNMAFFDDYPNEPSWLSPHRIDIIWFVMTSIGVFGYLFYRKHKFTHSFSAFYIYCLLSLGVLSHYLLAPMSAHTFTTNLTIWLEAFAACVLMLFVGWTQIRFYKAFTQ